MTVPKFRIPGPTHRTFVLGRTGTGKTTFAMWLLSEQAFDRMPWVIVDYKGDSNIGMLDRVAEISLDQVPKHPGLYTIKPRPEIDDAAVESWLLKIWDRENVGLYFDEIYMLPDAAGLRGILTQGRSKHIPAIILAQRPVWLSRFATSEADFFAVFQLNNKRDQTTVQENIPGALKARLPDYWCQWYDVATNGLFNLKPVPPADEIAESINDRTRPKRRWG